MTRPRVLLADDHAMFAEGLRHILAPHVDIVGVVGNGGQAVAAVRQLIPDVIVLDVSMPVMNGIVVARRLRELATPPKVVFCTMHADPAFLREALAAGAAGYVIKSAAGSEVIEAIRHVLRDETYVSPQLGNLISGSTESNR